MSDSVEVIQNKENGQLRLYGLIEHTQSDLDLLIGLDGLLFLKNDSKLTKLCSNLIKSGGIIRCIIKFPSRNHFELPPFLNLCTEIKCLDKIDGIVAVSECEYVKLSISATGTAILDGMYSNNKDVLPITRFSFETLFANASPFRSHMLKLVKNRDHSLSLPCINSTDNAAYKLSHFIEKSDHICIYSSIDELIFGYQDYLDKFKVITSKEKNGQHIRIRWLTTIRNKNDILFVNRFLKMGIEIRHLSEQPAFSFAVSDKYFTSIIKRIKKGKNVIDRLFLNSDQDNLLYFQNTFEKLWDTATDCDERVQQIVNHIDDKIEVIYDSNQALQRVYDLSTLVKKDILIILPSMNGFYRTEISGGFKMLNRLGERGIRVRILTIPDPENLMEVNKIKSKYHNLVFRDLEQTMMSYNRIIVFDDKNTLLWEVIDDNQQKYADALGLALFIESNKITETITIIFNSLWRQSEIHSRLKEAHENLKSHGRMQSRFMDLVAHELRTPLQSILGITELLKEEIKNNDQNFMLRVAMANAKKLQRLSENILDITRLEGNILYLNKEHFSINHLAIQITSDLVRNVEYNKYVAIEYVNFDKDILIFADKFRIGQVIQNLVDNSMRFVRNRGKITLKLNTKRVHSKNILELSVEDDGEQLKPEIFSKLFTKFASDSYYGPGIGLYLCRKIVEAHKGRIWAKNNHKTHGCTFTFRIPI